MESCANEVSEIVINEAGICECSLEALGDVRSVLQAMPSHCDAFHAYGHIMRDAGRMAEAVDAYSMAIDIAHRYHPLIHFEHSAICLALAITTYDLGDTVKANSLCEEAVFQDHQNATALTLLAHGWDALDNAPHYHSHVRLIINRVRELRRDDRLDDTVIDANDRLHDDAIMAWEDGNYGDALTLLSSFCDSRPELAIGWLHQGLVLLERQQFDAAHTMLAEALTHRQKVHGIYHRGAALHYLHRGQAHETMGEIELAYMDMIRAADIDVSFGYAKEERERIKLKL